MLDGDLAGDAAVGEAEQLAHVEDDGGERHPADLHVVFLARVVAREAERRIHRIGLARAFGVGRVGPRRLGLDQGVGADTPGQRSRAGDLARRVDEALRHDGRGVAVGTRGPSAR